MAIKHGHASDRTGKSPTYVSWQKMKERCNNPNHVRYYCYGGRGIKVCAQWDKSFVVFLKYMGERPQGMTLDRVNSNKGYEPGNVRWATLSQQNKNRRQ